MFSSVYPALYNSIISNSLPATIQQSLCYCRVSTPTLLELPRELRDEIYAYHAATIKTLRL